MANEPYKGLTDLNPNFVVSSGAISIPEPTGDSQADIAQRDSIIFQMASDIAQLTSQVRTLVKVIEGIAIDDDDSMKVTVSPDASSRWMVKGGAGGTLPTPTTELQVLAARYYDPEGNLLPPGDNADGEATLAWTPDWVRFHGQ